MRIRSITLENFVRIKKAKLKLPRRGVVLVTGDNDAGKSSIIEAVPAGLYNRTLRGTPWWSNDEQSRVKLGIGDEAIIDRTRNGAKQKLRLARIESEAEHDTTRKAQALLDTMIPVFEVWRKTSFFSSAAIEGEHFTSGGDGERKRLLEAVLDINKFDAALSACRTDLRLHEAMIEKRSHERELAQTKMANEDNRKEESAKRLNAIKVGDKPAAERAKEIGFTISKLMPDLEALKKLERKIALRANSQEGELRGVSTKFDLLRAGKCPTCEQAIPDQLIADLEERLAELQTAIKAVKKTHAKDLANAQAELEELQDTVNELSAQKRAISKHADAYNDLLAEKSSLEEAVKKAAMASTRYLLEKTDASAAITNAKREQALLQNVEHVLGLRGVRAHILAHTLVGLAMVANKWLAAFGTKIRVALSPYTEKKTGGHSDAISLTIDGAGYGYGYAACSVGQRRRIDIALLLGLATLAQAAHGMAEGTLFFDEVFDVLDAAGIAGVAGALQELATDRCVVVVTHSQSLAGALSVTKHWNVHNGEVEQR